MNLSSIPDADAQQILQDSLRMAHRAAFESAERSKVFARAAAADCGFDPAFIDAPLLAADYPRIIENLRRITGSRPYRLGKGKGIYEPATKLDLRFRKYLRVRPTKQWHKITPPRPDLPVFDVYDSDTQRIRKGLVRVSTHCWYCTGHDKAGRKDQWTLETTPAQWLELPLGLCTPKNGSYALSVDQMLKVPELAAFLTQMFHEESIHTESARGKGRPTVINRVLDQGYFTDGDWRALRRQYPAWKLDTQPSLSPNSVDPRKHIRDILLSNAVLDHPAVRAQAQRMSDMDGARRRVRKPLPAGKAYLSFLPSLSLSDLAWQQLPAVSGEERLALTVEALLAA